MQIEPDDSLLSFKVIKDPNSIYALAGDKLDWETASRIVAENVANSSKKMKER